MWTCRVPVAVAILFAAAIIRSPKLVRADDDNVVPDLNQEAVRIDREFAQIIEDYNQLLKQKRLNEAIVVGKQARLLRPDDPISVVMVFKAKLLKEATLRQLCGTLKATFDDDAPNDLGNSHTGQEILKIALETINQLGQEGDSDAWDCKSLLDASLERRIQSLDRIYGLTEMQMRKLRLAGRGDIQRFLNRIKGLNLKFESAQVDDDDDLAHLPKVNPFGVDRPGLFGKGSLFLKTLKTALTESQGAEFEHLAAQAPGDP